MSATEWETNEAGYRLRECDVCGGRVFHAEQLMVQGQPRMRFDPEPAEDGEWGIEERGMDRLIALHFSGGNLQALRLRHAPLYNAHDHG